MEAGTVFTNAGQIKHSFEDYANIMMCFPDHKGAFIETNWLTPRKVRTLSVTGTEGIINVDFITQTVSIENDKQIVQPFIGNGEPLTAGVGELPRRNNQRHAPQPSREKMG